MDAFSQAFRDFMVNSGASLCGFGDLQSMTDGDLRYGVSVAIALPVEIVQSIENGPSRMYFDAYHSISQRLDSIVTAGADHLLSKGYHAHAQTRANVVETPGYRTVLPHKTVATRAGLGWIGKSALLVTPEFGPAVRISSLLTNAPLETALPINHSKCGSCTACRDHCPGKAISGKQWDVNMDRDAFFHADDCRKAARALSAKQLNEEVSLCGKCIAVCPFTKRYMKNYVSNML